MFSFDEAQDAIQAVENRFQLMLQEREFFVKQIRDIRDTLDDDLSVTEILVTIEDILRRKNPVP